MEPRAIIDRECLREPNWLVEWVPGFIYWFVPSWSEIKWFFQTICSSLIYNRIDTWGKKMEWGWFRSICQRSFAKKTFFQRKSNKKSLLFFQNATPLFPFIWMPSSNLKLSASKLVSPRKRKHQVLFKKENIYIILISFCFGFGFSLKKLVRQSLSFGLKIFWGLLQIVKKTVRIIPSSREGLFWGASDDESDTNSLSWKDQLWIDLQFSAFLFL